MPADSEVQNLLAQAHELGVNLLDTAPAYGTSEERLGELLVNRQDWVICTKAGEEFVDGNSEYIFTPEHIEMSLNRSLERLHTDYIDVFMIHSDGNDLKIIEEFDIFHTLDRLKKSGKVRATGMSTKTVEGGKAVIDHCDVAMVAFNPVYTDELPVIEYAAEKGKGIFVKKAFASGHLGQISKENPVEKSVFYTLAPAGVTSLIAGTINPAHFRDNVEYAKSAT